MQKKQSVEMKESKEATIYDIAKALGLSPSTVSRGLKNHPAINKDTKKRIVEMANSMKYQHNTFASNLRKKNTSTIGVIIPRFDSYFMSTVIAGMEMESNKHGYNLILNQSQESVRNEMVSVNTLYHSRIDGLMVSLAIDTETLSHFGVLFSKKIPVIFFDRVMPNSDSPCVVIDNMKAAFDATTHLIDQGCKRIVHVGGGVKCSVYNERFNGYRHALESREIGIDKSLVYHNMLNEEDSIEVVNRILGNDTLPDGIFVANDSSAATILSELKKRGIRIPQDIAIIGFNNDPISRVVDPDLSTIHYPGMEMGKMTAYTLINMLKGNQAESLKRIVLNHKLVIRNSTLRSRL